MLAQQRRRQRRSSHLLHLLRRRRQKAAKTVSLVLLLSRRSVFVWQSESSSVLRPRFRFISEPPTNVRFRVSLFAFGDSLGMVPLRCLASCMSTPTQWDVNRWQGLIYYIQVIKAAVSFQGNLSYPESQDRSQSQVRRRSVKL